MCDFGARTLSEDPNIVSDFGAGAFRAPVGKTKMATGACDRVSLYILSIIRFLDHGTAQPESWGMFKIKIAPSNSAALHSFIRC